MLIDQKHYTIVRNDVPVLTKQADGSYNDTYNYLIDVNLKSDAIKQIIKPFGFGNNINDILEHLSRFSRQRFATFVFLALTTPKITTPDFNVVDDVLSICLYQTESATSYAWVHYFETNPKYRHGCANNAKYKHVGTSACHVFQEKYINRGIAARVPRMSVQDFLLKNGFKHMDEHESFLCWNLQR